VALMRTSSFLSSSIGKRLAAISREGGPKLLADFYREVFARVVRQRFSSAGWSLRDRQAPGATACKLPPTFNFDLSLWRALRTVARQTSSL